MDESNAFRVERAQRDDQPTALRRAGLVTYPADVCGAGIHHLDACVQRQLLCTRMCSQGEPLFDVDGLRDAAAAGGQQPLTVLGADPGIERPAVPAGGDQSRRVNDRHFRQIWQPHCRPVAMREVDVGQRKRARNECHVARIELALHPIRPDPIEVVLNDASVQEPARMHRDAGAQQLDGMMDFGRLTELLQAREQREGVEEPVRSRHVAHDTLPRKPLHPTGPACGSAGAAPLPACSSSRSARSARRPR